MRRVSGIVNASSMSAARDTGDATGDQERKANLAELSQRATALLDALPGDKYPEVVEAAKSIQGVMDLSVELDEAATRLRGTKQDSQEAVEAQRLLNGVRANVDAMIPPVMATMHSMLKLLRSALELDDQVDDIAEKSKLLEQSLSQEKARLAAAAKAVHNATQIG